MRHPRLWAIAGVLLVGTIIWLSVTPHPPDPGFEQGDKFEHILAYGTLMFWFSELYPSMRTRIALAIGFVAMGVGLEFVQRALVYRTYDVFDMLANTIGVFAGWAVARACGPDVFARIERLLR